MVAPEARASIATRGGGSEQCTPPHWSVAVTRGASGGDGGPDGASVGWGPGRRERLEARVVAVAPHACTTLMPPLTVA